MNVATGELAKLPVKFAALWRDATFRYWIGVILLFVLGIIGILFGNSLDRDSALHDLILGFSEAALISAVLALIVDPYLKRRLQEESGWSAIFAFLNPKAPPELKEAIQGLADCRVHQRQATWTIEFNWLDGAEDVVEVIIEVAHTSINLDRNAYKPSGKPWVLASIDGHQTRFLRYYLSCPGSISSIDMANGELDPYIDMRTDRSIFIDEEKIASGVAIPPDAIFDSKVRARMVRHAIGYIPLHNASFVSDLTIRLTGSALTTLDVTVSLFEHRGRRAENTQWKRPAGETKSDHRQFGHLTPGEVTLVSWSRPGEPSLSM